MGLRLNPDVSLTIKEKNHDFMLEYRETASLNLYNKCISLGLLRSKTLQKDSRAITTQKNGGQQTAKPQLSSILVHVLRITSNPVPAPEQIFFLNKIYMSRRRFKSYIMPTNLFL
jgi:hypothetical protein